jgi:hypothetical protein
MNLDEILINYRTAYISYDEFFTKICVWLDMNYPSYIENDIIWQLDDCIKTVRFTQCSTGELIFEATTVDEVIEKCRMYDIPYKLELLLNK